MPSQHSPSLGNNASYYSARVITRLSELFVRTLREDPADAEVPSHRWLVRAGYIRRAAPGIYTWLPLGYRVLRNVERIVREEMDAMGAQEVHFPALLPKEPYEVRGAGPSTARVCFGCTIAKVRNTSLVRRMRRCSPCW